jgi:hypothetical protein
VANHRSWRIANIEPVIDPAPIGFYETMAAASATVLGIGASVVAGRATAHAERASVLRVERGDMNNDLTVERLKKDWYLGHPRQRAGAGFKVMSGGSHSVGFLGAANETRRRIR